jgi:hypothetical protein
MVNLNHLPTHPLGRAKREISNDLQAHAPFAHLTTRPPSVPMQDPNALGLTIARTAIAGRTEKATAGGERKSLYRNDLRPDRQHPKEQHERRQRGGFLDHGPNHDPPPLLDRTGTLF